MDLIDNKLTMVTSSVKECWRGGYIIHARQAQQNLTIHISSASCEDSVANLPSPEPRSIAEPSRAMLSKRM